MKLCRAQSACFCPGSEGGAGSWGGHVCVCVWVCLGRQTPALAMRGAWSSSHWCWGEKPSIMQTWSQHCVKSSWKWRQRESKPSQQRKKPDVCRLTYQSRLEKTDPCDKCTMFVTESTQHSVQAFWIIILPKLWQSNAVMKLFMWKILKDTQNLFSVKCYQIKKVRGMWFLENSSLNLGFIVGFGGCMKQTLALKCNWSVCFSKRN